MKKSLFLFFLFPFFLFSQNDSLESSFRFSYSNDLFNATDRYFTQDITLALEDPLIAHSPLSHVLLTPKNAMKQYQLSLSQDVFTPYTILSENIQKNDRPYTALLYATHRVESYTKGFTEEFDAQLDVGVMGPAAGGEQMQKGIHHALDNALPRGWKYQLANDIVINYDLRYEENFINTKWIHCYSLLDIRAGTLYDDAGIGFGFWSGRARQDKKFHLRWYALNSVHAVAYNATLQGGVFNRSSEYVLSGDAINRVLYKAEGGIGLGWKRVEISYCNSYITAEFDHGLDHGWGQVAIRFQY
jgi:hypothetical protein